MSKKLSEMTIEELWQLFPIYLAGPDEKYRAWYAEEAAEIRRLVPEGLITAIHHIGSTAINGIWAKPIVDILIEAKDTASLDEICRILTASGMICMSRQNERISLNKGYTENGFAEKVFHLHLRLTGNRDEVYFRDHLNTEPEIAKEYEKLKLDLWKEYEHDRDGYTAAKTGFVKKYTLLAKLRFEFMENARFDEFSDALFSILHSNMTTIVGFENTYAEECAQWHNAVGSGMKKSARRIVLIHAGSVIAGFFQYYTNADTFMMEEIQLLPEYRNNGIFRSLYKWLIPQLPSGINTVKAFAHAMNTNSDRILRHMGLLPEGNDGVFVAYSCSYETFLKWYN